MSLIGPTRYDKMRWLIQKSPGEWHYIETATYPSRVHQVRTFLGASEFQVRQRKCEAGLKIEARTRA